MKGTWSLQDAKNKFSQVVDEAHKGGPQIVTKRGVESVVIMSIDEYKKLIRPTTNLIEFFRESPLHGIDLDVERSKDVSRKVDL